MPRRQVLPYQNPKSEYRNPKQTQRQINLKSGKFKTPNPNEACLEFCMFWSFEFVSNFGFRASNLRFSNVAFFARDIPRPTGARSAPYQNLRVLRAFVVKTILILFACGCAASILTHDDAMFGMGCRAYRLAGVEALGRRRDHA